MTFLKKRIEDDFYPLTMEDFERIASLKPSELKIFLYLKILDPYGNQFLDVDYEELKDKCQIRSYGTIYPALKALDAVGLIQLHHTKSLVHVPDQKTDPRIVKLKMRSRNRSGDQENDPNPSELKNQPLEPLPINASEPPKNNKKDLEVLESEKNKNREDYSTDAGYRRFCELAVEALPHPPKGVYKERLIQRELRNEENQTLYRQLLDRTIIPLPAPEAENFESKPPDLTTKVKSWQAMWASPSLRATIRKWCDLNGVDCNDDGPQLPG